MGKARIFSLMDVFGVFFPTGIEASAHLAGMGLGLMYGLMLKKEKEFYREVYFKKSILRRMILDEYLKSGRI